MDWTVCPIRTPKRPLLRRGTNGDRQNVIDPILQVMTNFTITDESFLLMTWAKSRQIQVLATAAQAPTASACGHEGEVVPQS